MGARQKYRLRARSDREVIREVEPGKVYVDRDSGEEFEVVGKVLPLAPSPSELPWAVEQPAHVRLLARAARAEGRQRLPALRQADARNRAIGRR